MLFTPLHCKSITDNFLIVGAIFYSLLNACCIQENFSSIQEHIRTGLTYTSNVIGFDPKYICHCYDIMAKLDASCNDT